MNVLNDRQRLVLEIIHKQIPEKQALAYLKENGFESSEATLRRDKKKIRENSLQRLYVIAKVGFVTQHINRIDKLEIIEKEMWANYKKITDPYKQVLVLEKIANIQPILSAYYDSSRYALEKSNNQQTDNLS